MPSVIVLCSGGVDSTACISYCLRNGYGVEPLFVAYGQPAVRCEGNAAGAICDYYGLSLQRVSVTGLPTMTAGFIQGRNGLLLATALALLNCTHSMAVMGLHRDSSYPDCDDSFLRAYQSIYDIYTNGTVQIHAPFLLWSKNEIWQFCHMVKVPLHLTYSCEAGTEPPCGECLSCRDLKALSA